MYNDPMVYGLIQDNNYLRSINNTLEVNNIVLNKQLQNREPKEKSFNIFTSQENLICQYSNEYGCRFYLLANFVLHDIKIIEPVPSLNYSKIYRIQCSCINKKITFLVEYKDFNVNGLYNSLVNAGLGLALIRSKPLKFSKELFFEYVSLLPIYKNAEIIYAPSLPGWFLQQDQNPMFATADTFPECPFHAVSMKKLQKVNENLDSSNAIVQLIPLFSIFKDPIIPLILILIRELSIINPLIKDKVSFNNILLFNMDSAGSTEIIMKIIQIYETQGSSIANATCKIEQFEQEILEASASIFAVNLDIITKNKYPEKMDYIKNIFEEHVKLNSCSKNNTTFADCLCCLVTTQNIDYSSENYFKLFICEDDFEKKYIHGLTDYIKLLAHLDREIIKYCSKYFSELKSIIDDGEFVVNSSIVPECDFNTRQVILSFIIVFEVIKRIYSIYGIDFVKLLPFSNVDIPQLISDFIIEAIEGGFDCETKDLLRNSIINSTNNGTIEILKNNQSNLSKTTHVDSSKMYCYADSSYLYIPVNIFDDIIFPDMNIKFKSKAKLFHDMKEIMRTGEGRSVDRRTVYPLGKKEAERIRCYSFRLDQLNGEIGDELLKITDLEG